LLDVEIRANSHDGSGVLVVAICLKRYRDDLIEVDDGPLLEIELARIEIDGVIARIDIPVIDAHAHAAVHDLAGEHIVWTCAIAAVNGDGSRLGLGLGEERG